MDNVLISVIVPCYNAAPYLAAAINSIFAQGYTPLEVIIVDDGSTDGSTSVAQSFGDRVVFLQQAHQGISAARNQGLRHCRGALIAFLDADDLWTDNSLDCRLQALQAHPQAGYVFGSVQQFLSADLGSASQAPFYCPPDVRPARLASALLLRRQTFLRTGYFNTALQIGETLDWVARTSEAGIVSVGLPDVVLQRRIHATNTVTREHHRQHEMLFALKASLDRRRQQPDLSTESSTDSV